MDLTKKTNYLLRKYDPKHYEREVIRATKHLIRWIKKGDNAETALSKVNQSYGFSITREVKDSLRRVLN